MKDLNTMKDNVDSGKKISGGRVANGLFLVTDFFTT